MTKEKLGWINKDKLKLQKQLEALERSYKDLEEKHSVLQKDYAESLKEIREVEYKFKGIDKSTCE